MPSILIIGNILHPTNTSQSAVSIQHSAFRYYEAFIQIWSLIQSSQAGRKTAAYSRIVYKLLEGYKQYIHVYTNYLNYLLILIQEVIQRCTPSECTHFSDAFLFENLLTSSLGPHIMQISINFSFICSFVSSIPFNGHWNNTSVVFSEYQPEYLLFLIM